MRLYGPKLGRPSNGHASYRQQPDEEQGELGGRKQMWENARLSKRCHGCHLAMMRWSDQRCG